MSSRDVLSTRTRFAYVEDDSLVQQALFLSSHDKVVRVVPVVHNVLQVDACNEDNVSVTIEKFKSCAKKKGHQGHFLETADSHPKVIGWQVLELKFKRHAGGCSCNVNALRREMDSLSILPHLSPL